MKKWGSEEIISCCLEHKVEVILWLWRRYESNIQKRKQRRWENTREQRRSFGVWVCIGNQEYKETYRGSKKTKEGTSKRNATLYIYIYIFLFFLSIDGSLWKVIFTLKGHGNLHDVYKCLFEMKSEHLWTKFICETCMKLNKLSYQIMQKKKKKKVKINDFRRWY